MPYLLLSDSLVGKLGNLLFPNLFSFSGIQALLCLEHSKNIIELLVHTCISPCSTDAGKSLHFHQKEARAVPGTLAAVCPPAEPLKAVICSSVVPSCRP